MPDAVTLSLFLVSALLLTLTPGPAVLYIVTRSIAQGRAAGVVSCMGIALGGCAHVLAAALGLSAMLASSAMAFALVKYAGAAYLIWLGYRKFARQPDVALAPAVDPDSLRRVFWQGVAVNVLNPKTAPFFLAFLPQFADPSRGAVTSQLVLLGALFLIVALSTDMLWALLAGGARDSLLAHPRLARSERYVTGSVYLGLGFAAALSGNGADK
jgi:threonine/homoserine/homoserine lactone efflux protein